MVSWPIRLLAAILSGNLLLLTACREDVETFEPIELTRGETGRLTFSGSDDRSPSWTPSGDAILYSTNGLVGVDSGPGLLVRLSLEDGLGQALLPTIQSPEAPTDHWLLAPAARPDGEAVAFAEILHLWDAHPCNLLVTKLSCAPQRFPEEAEQPPLRLISIRTRTLDATGAFTADPKLEFTPEGVLILPGDPLRSIVADHPYQQLFNRDRAPTFRPAWSADGTRLVFSDGLRLLIWTVGSGAPEPVPNTEDGVWPAWSPDGEWIAFTRLERADSKDVFCEYVSVLLPAIVCQQQRMEYTIGRHILSLVCPDGGELRELAEGDGPAPAPDGSTLYFRTENRIMSISVGGGSPQAVPGTENSRELAVSPDGRLLAFAKLEGEDHDIWVAGLKSVISDQ